jgi:hypothetical protein
LIGYVSADGEYSVLFSVRKKPSKLIILPPSEFIVEDYGSFFVSMAGQAADASACRAHCNLLKNSQMFTFGSAPSISYFAKSVAKWLTRGMYRGQNGDDDDESVVVRPLAVSVLLSGEEVEDDRVRLVVVECSGSVRESTFVCLGEEAIPGGKATLRTIHDYCESAVQTAEGGGSGIDARSRFCKDAQHITSLLLEAVKDTEENNSGSESSNSNSGDTSGDAEGANEEAAERRSPLLLECSVAFRRGNRRSPTARMHVGRFSSLQGLTRLLQTKMGADKDKDTDGDVGKDNDAARSTGEGLPQ